MQAWARERPPSALFDLTPGAGKTIVIGRIGHAVLNASAATRLLVVGPTDYLRVQIAREFAALDLSITPEFRASDLTLPSHYDGATLTYAQVAANPEAFRRLSAGALVSMDEVHHVGAHATWGAAMRYAFEPARHRLLLTGTAFRSDDGEIPFVTYRIGEAQAIYRYGYGDALEDGIVRPAAFQVVGARVKWRSSDGTERDMLTSQNATKELAAERLRALVWSREWFRAAFAAADAHVQRARAEGHAAAAGLVGAVDVAHARTLVQWIAEDFGVAAAIATSDDPSSLATIDGFRTSSAPWIVAVRQISEGVNIRRLRAIVWATNMTAKLFFAQLVGRALRHEDDIAGEQESLVVLPQDETLIGHATSMLEVVRLWGIARRVKGTAPPALGRGALGEESKFGVIATESFEAGRVLPGEVRIEEAVPRAASAYAPAEFDPLAAQRELRTQVNRLVADVARITGTAHSKIHARLNKRCGGTTLARATNEQVLHRIRELERAKVEKRL